MAREAVQESQGGTQRAGASVLTITVTTRQAAARWIAYQSMLKVIISREVFMVLDNSCGAYL